jgi:hypothetical protein
MKILNTFTLSREKAAERVKRFYDIDKRRTLREGRTSRDAQLTIE